MKCSTCLVIKTTEELWTSKVTGKKTSTCKRCMLRSLRNQRARESDTVAKHPLLNKKWVNV